MITEKNTSPRKAFRSAPKSVEQDASLENASCSDSKEEQAVLSGRQAGFGTPRTGTGTHRRRSCPQGQTVRKIRIASSTCAVPPKSVLRLRMPRASIGFAPPGIKGSSPGFSRPVSPSSPICSRTLRTLPCRSSLCLIRCRTPATPEPSPARYTRWAGPAGHTPPQRHLSGGRGAPRRSRSAGTPSGRQGYEHRPGAGRGTGRGIPHLRGRRSAKAARRLHHPPATPPCSSSAMKNTAYARRLPNAATISCTSPCCGHSIRSMWRRRAAS